MAAPVVHFEIVGPDGAALRAFYGGLFDWPFQIDEAMDYGLVMREEVLSDEGIGIGGGVGQAPPGSPGHLTFYVQVPDVEAALARAQELGGERVMGPQQIMPDLVIGQLRDPEGRLVGVLQSVA